MVRWIANCLIAGLFAGTVLLGLVVLGAATSLRSHPTDLAAVTPPASSSAIAGRAQPREGR